MHCHLKIKKMSRNQKHNRYATLMFLSIMAGLACIAIGTQTKKSPENLAIAGIGLIGAAATTRKLYQRTQHFSK